MRHYVLAAMPALLIAATAQAASFTETKLTARDGATQSNFGLSIAISGTTAIIGAWGTGDNGLLNSGAAYLAHRQ